MKLSWRFSVPAGLAGAGVAAVIMMSGIGAGASAPVTPTNPPPVPQIVNADGTINTNALQHMAVNGNPNENAAQAFANSMRNANLTPGQVQSMTPAQQAANGIQSTP